MHGRASSNLRAHTLVTMACTHISFPTRTPRTQYVWPHHLRQQERAVTLASATGNASPTDAEEEGGGGSRKSTDGDNHALSQVGPDRALASATGIPSPPGAEGQGTGSRKSPDRDNQHVPSQVGDTRSKPQVCIIDANCSMEALQDRIVARLRVYQVL